MSTQDAVPAHEVIADAVCGMLQPLMVASHLLVIEELRAEQGKSFDTDEEFRRLMQRRFDAAQLLQRNRLTGREALRCVLARRAEASE